MKNSNKALTIAVVLLLLVNIGLVIFLLTGKGHDSRRTAGRTGGPFDMMAKELNLSEQQKKQFGEMREAHFKIVRPLFDSIRAAKVAFYGLIRQSPVNDSIVDSYEHQLNNLQARADKLTFAHFLNVRTLFEGEQQRQFDEFVQKMMQRSGPGGRRRDSTAEKR